MYGPLLPTPPSMLPPMAPRPLCSVLLMLPIHYMCLA